MGKIVGGFLVPHDPVMFVAPQAPAQEIRDRMWGAFEQCAQRLAALKADAVVVVGSDHYMLFGTSCLPAFLIGTGDVDGPLDQLPGLRRETIPAHEALAGFIASHGRANGLDWAVARALTVDHAIAIPEQKIIKPAREAGQSIGTVPVYLASGVDPYITLARAAQVGQGIRQAVEAFEQDVRVAVIGSGGLSHWVGTAEMGRVSEAFDRRILDFALRGDVDGMAALTDEYILAEGGNGGMEIRNWLCAMAAAGPYTGELIDYAPVPEWVTGLGFVHMQAH
ncbi:hypothetical protein ABFV80_002873 [Vandammella animalimorsus]|uniref:DODA-type extradiol aromatic ring-opening family dioxygenase n=1 Tax=Vandammella animalimorsus TaxID=2029117 RepID=UPI00325B2BF3